MRNTKKHTRKIKKKPLKRGFFLLLYFFSQNQRCQSGARPSVQVTIKWTKFTLLWGVFADGVGNDEPTGRNRERPPVHAPVHTPVSTFECVSVSVSSVVVKSTLIYKKINKSY